MKNRTTLTLLSSFVALFLYSETSVAQQQNPFEVKQQTVSNHLQDMLGEKDFQEMQSLNPYFKPQQATSILEYNYQGRSEQGPLFEDVAHPFETFFFQAGAVGDYDGDGYDDLLLCGAIDTNNSGNPDTSFCQLYKNNGGQFEAVEGFEVISKHLGAVRFIDWNNNGLLDIVISGQDYNNLYEYFTFFYKNTGNGFELTDTYPGYIYSEFWTADINLNGKTDLISNGRSSNGSYGPETILYENLGDYNFEWQELPVVATQMMGNMKLIDVNNDNLVDMVLMGMDASYAPVFNIYLNTGDGFELHQSLEGLTFGSMNTADFNGDGFPDLVANGNDSGSSKKLRVYWNDGTGTFTMQELSTPLSNSAGTQAIDVGDLTNNGYYDFIVYGDPASVQEAVYIYTYNPGTNTMELFQEETGLLEIGSSPNVHLLDFDNDNLLDIMVSGYAHVDGNFIGVTKLYKNVNPEANQAPTPPTQLEVEEDGEYMVFTWEGATDDKTPYESLRYEIRVGSQRGEADIAKYVVTTPHWKLKTDALPEDGFVWAIKSIDASKTYSEESDEAVYGELATPSFTQTNWQLYPNPATSVVHINGENINAYNVYSIDGRRVLTGQVQGENFSFSIESLKTGVYLVEVINSYGNRAQRKLIKH